MQATRRRTGAVSDSPYLVPPFLPPGYVHRAPNAIDKKGYYSESPGTMRHCATPTRVYIFNGCGC